MSETANPTLPGNKPFLSHIEGLRGLAIILIVLYHLNPEWCVRGYFGVDVFLVISGYLIYKGYLAGQKNYHSFGAFCRSRLARLLPPLLAMLAAYHLGSMFLLDSREWASHCPSALAGMLGYANMYFDQEIQNYFAAATARYPLLHLWYLSVILHFYLLFAIVFILFKKIPTKWRLGFMILLALCSFWFSRSWETPCKLANSLMGAPAAPCPTSVYYWSIARFWECIAGMLIVYLPSVRNNAARTLLPLIGLLAIVLPSFITHLGEQQNLLAVAGTVLLIAYVPANFSARLLDNPILRFFGQISFSLYLWHYFIFNIWKHFTYWYLTPWHQYLYMLGFAVILSWAAWWLIERRKFPFSLTMSGWGILLALTILVIQFPRIHQRINYTKRHLDISKTVHEWQSVRGTPYEKYHSQANFTPWRIVINRPEDNVLLLGDATKKPHFLLLGDSHAHTYAPGIDLLGREMGFSGILPLTRPLPMCRSDFSLQKPQQEQHMTEQVVNYLAGHEELEIVLATCRWGAEFTQYNNQPEAALRRFCEEIRKLNRKLILITDNPTLPEPKVSWYVTFCRINNIAPRKEVITCSEEAYYRYNKRALKAMDALEKEGLCHVVHVEPYLFENGIFNLIKDDGSIRMYDEHHLTTDTAVEYIQKMKKELCGHLQPVNQS